MKLLNVFMLLLAILSMLIHKAGAQPQIYNFSTIAGLAGISGSADGTNGRARFDGPIGIALDHAGAFYVADNLNATIRKLTSAGSNWVTITIAGLVGSQASSDGTNTAARFSYPYGVAVDDFGNLFVTDHDDHTIRKLTPMGTNWVSSTMAGLLNVPGSADGTNTAARFNTPTALAVDQGGNLYVADHNNSTIRKLTPIGTNWVTSTIAGLAGSIGSAEGTNSAIRFNHPAGVAVGGDGVVYLADTLNNTVRKLTPIGKDWVSSTIAGLSGNAGGNDGTNSAARFNTPNGVAVDAGGNLYVADWGNNTIRKLTSAGTNWVTSTIAGRAGSIGSADGTNSAARFNRPIGIALGGSGYIYVTDLFNNTIREGRLSLGPSTPPVFQKVEGLNGRIVFTWSPIEGQTYQFEFTSELSQTNWHNLGNAMTATNGTMSAADVIGPDRQRFYRIVLVP
jgi:hypothetical protein